MQALVNTPIDLPLPVYLLQGVVEGFYKYVGVDPCTMSLYSSKPFQTYTLYVYYLQYSLCFYLAVTAGPLLWALGVVLLEILTKFTSALS